MTEIGHENKKREQCDDRLSAGRILFCIMSALALLITFRHSDIAISSMSEGMRLCTSTVIPALFPFMVISELVVSSGCAELVSRMLGGVFKALFGIRREGAIAFLLGALCGFPIGAKSAISLYDRGKISGSELEHLLSFCNGPSSAFLISAVGISLFGSRGFGTLLYVADMLSAITVGIVGRIYFDSRGRKIRDVRLDEAGSGCEIKNKGSGIGSLSGAITSSANSMLHICAFIVFFSAITGIFDEYSKSVGLNGEIRALSLGFFEMTGGVYAASALPGYYACLSAAAIVGWSGLSVHFQLISLCSERKISYRPYFISKLARACLNVVFVSAALALFGNKIEFSGEFAASFLAAPSLHPIHLLTLTVFAVGAVKSINKKVGG